MEKLKNQILIDIDKITDVKILVQIFELAFYKSGAKTLSNYAKSNGVSYNTAKKYRTHAILDGIKYVVSDSTDNSNLPF